MRIFRTFIIHPNVIYLACNHTENTLWWCHQKRNEEKCDLFHSMGAIEDEKCFSFICVFVCLTDQQWDGSAWVPLHWIKFHTSKKLPIFLSIWMSLSNVITFYLSSSQCLAHPHRYHIRLKHMVNVLRMHCAWKWQVINLKPWIVFTCLFGRHFCCGQAKRYSPPHTNRRCDWYRKKGECMKTKRNDNNNNINTKKNNRCFCIR